MTFKYNEIQSWEIPEKNVISLKIISKKNQDDEMGDDDKDKTDEYAFISPNVFIKKYIYSILYIQFSLLY